MPRGIRNTPRAAEVTNGSPLHLEDLKGWDKLSQDEQTLVRRETQATKEALYMEGQSKLATGEHLHNVRPILEREKMFVAYLDKNFGMSRRTAYRRIELYTSATQKLPTNILEAVIGRGVDIRPQAIENAPPAPKTSDPVVISEYVAALESVPYRSQEPPEANPDTLMKECLNFVGTRFDRLPSTGRVRSQWIQSFVGMILARFGVASQQSFSPTAIPEKFKVVRGRPKENIAA